MRVALVIFGDLDQPSGGYFYDRELVEALRDEGHEVRVAPQPAGLSYREQIELGRRVSQLTIADSKRTDSARPSPGGGARPALRVLISAQPDIVLIDELNHAATAPWVSRIRTQLPDAAVVGVVHHLRCDEPAGRRRTRRLERQFLRGCDAWICNSATTLSRVRRLSRRRRSSAVVHPAGDAAGYGTEPERNGDSLRLTDENASVPKSRRRETTQRGRFKLLSVGTLIPRKNLEVVIRAVAELSYCDLVIVGDESVDPKYAGRIRRMVAERALSDRIIMRGRVPTDVLEREYRSADLFVAPSKYEGFGIVYLESLSRGVPVIASGAGGAQEVVRDGTDGYVVSPDRPADVVGAIDRLYEDPDTLTAMRESALERAEMFHDWRRTMRGAVRFLEVVGSRGHETQRKTRS